MSFSMKVLGVLIPELREIVVDKSLSAISFQINFSSGVRIWLQMRKMSDTFCESDLLSSIKFGTGSVLGKLNLALTEFETTNADISLSHYFCSVQ